MSQISDRLLTDLRWRLSPAGKRYQPARRERDSWGGAVIPAASAWLGGCGSSALTFGLAVAAMDGGAEPVGVMLLLMMFAAFPVSFWIRNILQQRADVAAYKRLLQANERFALVEYSKLLSRQIQAARSDPALGGPAEVARLSESLQKINQLLRDGAGEAKPGQSAIANEALLAESIVEVYSVGKSDGLAELDARLPQELRARLDEGDDGEAGAVRNAGRES